MTDRPALHTIELSDDELAFLMTLFGLGEIGGFHVPPGFDRARALAAGDSLIGHGLTVISGDSPAIHPDVIALVMSAVTYTVALGLNTLSGQAWYYLRPDRVVCQRRVQGDPQRGNLQRFEVLDGLQSLSAALGNALQADEGTPADSPFWVPKALIAAAEDACLRETRTTGVQMLMAAGLPANFAQNIFEEPQQVMCVVIRLLQDTDGAYQSALHAMMLIRAERGYWVLEEDTQNAERLIAHPFDSAGVVGHLIGLTRI